MSSDSETPFFLGSTNFTRLSVVLRLMNLKVINRWIDKRSTKLLQLLKDMIPEGNTLPNRNHEAQKILCLLGMKYKRYMHVLMIVYYIGRILRYVCFNFE